MSAMPFPFEIPFEEVREDLDTYVDEVFAALRSEFLTLPRGEGFIDYPVFEQGYEALKQVTSGFRNLPAESVAETVYRVPVALVVLRSILGFTPPEWAYVTSQRTGVEVPQGAARTLDRTVRLRPLTPMRTGGGVTERRIQALVATACELLAEGAPHTPGTLHRLDKADTRSGLASLHPLVDLGVPYAMLLYERFLGRPFAGHRDSVSELVGDVLEAAIEAVLSDAGISFRKTRRAERLPGFDQAPDFIVPDEFNPQIVIEAKLTEDDGTARDKVTRVQHLGALSTQGRQPHQSPRFEVIACIAGRGFKVRREDMKKLILSTRGKVFTLANLERLIDCTRLGVCAAER
jgi:hypothetical protein